MNDFSTFVEKSSTDLVQTFQSETSGQLDYSEQSLVAVEAILDRLSREDLCSDKDRYNALVEGFGCYIFEVARKEFGGRFCWHNKESEPVLVVGEPKFHVAILTWQKVKGRLSGDTADNIPFFYGGFAQRAREARSGDHVLYT